MPSNKHTFGEGAWHRCARCDDRCNVRDLQWQRGLLLCKAKCIDNQLIGDIDARRSIILQQALQYPEVMPDPKLTEPTLTQGPEDIML